MARFKTNARWSAVLATCVVLVATVLPTHAASVGEAEVRQCAEEIFRLAAGGQCSSYFSIKGVRKVDARESGGEANVIADIDFQVKQKLGGSTSGASQCTGNSWKIEVKNPYPPNSAQWLMYQSQADMSGGYLEPGRGLRVRKNFKFEKWDSGWRCAEQSMSPLMLVWDDVKIASAPVENKTPRATQEQSERAESKDTVKYDCTRSDKPEVKTILVVDLANRTVKSLNGFGGLGGSGVPAQITDTKISWQNTQKKNYGMGGSLNFFGSIDRATRDFSFKGSDNRTYAFKCR